MGSLGWDGLLVLLSVMLLSHGHPPGTKTVTLLSAHPSQQVTRWDVRSFLRGAKPLMEWRSSPDSQQVPGPMLP